MKILLPRQTSTPLSHKKIRINMIHLRQLLKARVVLTLSNNNTASPTRRDPTTPTIEAATVDKAEVATEAATTEITKRVVAIEAVTTETTKKVVVATEVATTEKTKKVVATEVVEITIEVSTEASRREESGRTEAASTRTEVLKVVTTLKARMVATKTRATTTA